jgi:hypothetical protein
MFVVERLKPSFEGFMEERQIELPPKAIPQAEEQAVATSQQVELLTTLPKTGGIIQSPKSLAMLELEETGKRCDKRWNFRR